MKLKTQHIITVFLLGATLLTNTIRAADKIDNSSPTVYEDLYDPLADSGQYWMEENRIKPTMIWDCTGLSTAHRNLLGETQTTRGLQYHLTVQSMVGLTAKAMKEGKTTIGIWLKQNNDSYDRIFSRLVAEGATNLGSISGLDLLTKELTLQTRVKHLFSGYILTDIENYPESNIVATVASHIHNAIIVDVRDTVVYKQAGYRMVYDARFKSTREAWIEFKDKCNNKGLILTTVNTGFLREFAISNGYFVINLNKKSTTALFENMDLYYEVLAWLQPGSPVFGWEGQNEQQFTEPISRAGHIFTPYGGGVNTTLSSAFYTERNPTLLAKVMNPKSIDFSKSGKFVSFFLTDGDNVPWMMNNFDSKYLFQPATKTVSMAHTFYTSALSMLVPDQLPYLYDGFEKNNTVIEFGGGYIYYDKFAELTGNRTEALRVQARKVAAHMRQRRIKVLGMFLREDVFSEKAKEAYRIMIENNDQLEGIITVQYNPYNGGKGSILWFTNSRGISIPVITTRYSIWNFGDRNKDGQGTPRYVANRINESSQNEPFSTVAVHAWSYFRKSDTADELAENDPNGEIFGAGAAELSTNAFNSNVNTVSLQELIWRVRMRHYPLETTVLLNNFAAPNSAPEIQRSSDIAAFYDNQTSSIRFSESLTGLVTLYDLNGRRIKQDLLENMDILPDVVAEKGMYILNIRMDIQNISIKIHI